MSLTLLFLIISNFQIFKPFARHWLRPLCQLLLGGTYGDSGINVFLVDVMVTMLSWNKVAIPQVSTKSALLLIIGKVNR